MRLVSLLDETDTARTGMVVGDEVVDLTDPAIGLPAGMVELLALGDDAEHALDRAGSSGAAARSPWTAPG